METKEIIFICGAIGVVLLFIVSIVDTVVSEEFAHKKIENEINKCNLTLKEFSDEIYNTFESYRKEYVSNVYLGYIEKYKINCNIKE